MRSFSGLRAVALFEAAKGALVLLAGFGVFALLHLDAQHAADELVSHLHLNPASRYPGIFRDLAREATAPHLWLLAAGALCYALLHFIEAYGLWRDRRWAEWLAVLISGFYIPIEIWELIKHVTWLRIAFPAVNIVIVVYMVRTLTRTDRQNRCEADKTEAG